LDLGGIGWGGVDWIGLARVRDQWRILMNTIKNVRVQQNVGHFLRSITTGALSRRVQHHGVSYFTLIYI
jgi:hypothetical protein